VAPFNSASGVSSSSTAHLRVFGSVGRFLLPAHMDFSAVPTPAPDPWYDFASRCLVGRTLFLIRLTSVPVSGSLAFLRTPLIVLVAVGFLPFLCVVVSVASSRTTFVRSACVAEAVSDLAPRTSLLIVLHRYRNRPGYLSSSSSSPVLPRSHRLEMLSWHSLCCLFFASWWLYSASLALWTLLSTPQSVLEAPRAFFAVPHSGSRPWSRVSMRAVCMSAACSLLAPCT
jgi:hypothetical protein